MGFVALWLLCAHTLQAQGDGCQTKDNMIKSVSVVEYSGSYNAFITWNKPDNMPPDANGYIIYEFLGLPYCWQLKAVISSLTVTNYTLPDVAPLGYTIAVNRPLEPDPHTHRHRQSMIELPITFDPCTYEAEIHWTPYIGWDAADTEYAVLVDVGDTGTYTLLAAGLSATSYVWSNAPARETIKIKVRAVNKRDNTAVSDSKPETTFFNFPRPPVNIFLSELQDNGGSYSLYFNIDPTTELTDFEVQRATDDGDFSTVYTFSDKSLSNYTDVAGAGLFRYRIAAKNECGNVVCSSSEVVNIRLDIIQDGSNWQLQWSSARPALIVHYTLDRQLPAPANLLLNSTATSYTDPITVVLAESSLQFCYTILGRVIRDIEWWLAPPVVTTSGNCAYCKPTITMPDAVDPLSTVVNPQTGRARNQFGPVISADPRSYSYRLTILNRNAAVVADIVKNPNDSPLDKSWNGYLKNDIQGPEEVYTYHLSVEFEGGYQETITGTVVVVYSK